MNKRLLFYFVLASLLTQLKWGLWQHWFDIFPELAVPAYLLLVVQVKLETEVEWGARMQPTATTLHCLSHLVEVLKKTDTKIFHVSARFIPGGSSQSPLRLASTTTIPGDLKTRTLRKNALIQKRIMQLVIEGIHWQCQLHWPFGILNT